MIFWCISSSMEQHAEHVAVVLDILQKHQLFAKPSKCSFAQASIDYLGHIISAQGVATDPSKIAAVKAWPVPTNLKDLRGFLGLTGYYRKFIQHYGLISKALTELLKKNVPFMWTSTSQTAFDTLKEALITAPVLALPNFKQPLS
ncbi:hypothetical protein GQ55_5G198900 [Panicum hallii var. hallii]|uniref:Reverse transcriptase domain-containing protein n=1 Tax=Panicum hallii var. hallii TaxID=1504633 RepID=A0A2T7DI61_9POAL|nr:hypothetical protein GQ55_5G198900 [Panicum hallii var. hallii]